MSEEKKPGLVESLAIEIYLRSIAHPDRLALAIEGEDVEIHEHGLYYRREDGRFMDHWIDIEEPHLRQQQRRRDRDQTVGWGTTNIRRPDFTANGYTTTAPPADTTDTAEPVEPMPIVTRYNFKPNIHNRQVARACLKEAQELVKNLAELGMVS